MTVDNQLKDCRKQNCDKVVPEKDIVKSRQAYLKSIFKKCKSKKNNYIKSFKCANNMYKKSKYKKLKEKNEKCVKKHCSKELDGAIKNIIKGMKNQERKYKDTKKKKKSKQKKSKKSKKTKKSKK